MKVAQWSRALILMHCTYANLSLYRSILTTVKQFVDSLGKLKS